MPNIIGLLEKSDTGSEKNESNNIEILPYIKELINRGVLLKDGKTVAKSLNDVALEMLKLNMKLSEILLMDSFVKRNGDKYSPKTCKKAVIFANTYVEETV